MTQEVRDAQDALDDVRRLTTEAAVAGLRGNIDTQRTSLAGAQLAVNRVMAAQIAADAARVAADAAQIAADTAFQAAQTQAGTLGQAVQSAQAAVDPAIATLESARDTALASPDLTIAGNFASMLAARSSLNSLIGTLNAAVNNAIAGYRTLGMAGTSLLNAGVSLARQNESVAITSRLADEAQNVTESVA